MLVRDVHDPGIGFVTLTRVQVSPDLQLARVFYTVLGDEKARKNSGSALERADRERLANVNAQTNRGRVSLTGCKRGAVTAWRRWPSVSG